MKNCVCFALLLSVGFTNLGYFHGAAAAKCTVDGNPVKSGDAAYKGTCTEAYQVCKDDGTCAGCSRDPFGNKYAVGNGKSKGTCQGDEERCQADGTCYAATYKEMAKKKCKKTGRYSNSPDGIMAVCNMDKTGCKGYQIKGTTGKTCLDVAVDGTGLEDDPKTTVFIKTN